MDYTKYIGVTPDFPKKGISFKDVSPLLACPEAFHSAMEDMAKIAEEFHPDVIIGPDARGFLFGAPLALRMNLPFVMARKAGKLPGKTYKKTYTLEYGTDTIEVPQFAIHEGQRVLLIDDLMATGGTFAAIKELLEEVKAVPVACLTMINLKDLHGEKNVGIPCRSILDL